MNNRILYIEDLVAGSGTIKHELESKGFEVTVLLPDLFTAIEEAKHYNLILIDYRLTAEKGMFDAPTFAQPIRTPKAPSHSDIPIVLVSSESIISDFYSDPTSHDLFDLALPKGELLGNVNRYALRFKSLIDAYDKIQKLKFESEELLGLEISGKELVDFRALETLGDYQHQGNVFTYSSFVLKELVRSIGTLIGEDVLAARLGVDQSSKDWSVLKEQMKPIQYAGIYSEAYPRWWGQGLLAQWTSLTGSESSLRRATAEERVALLHASTGLDLRPVAMTKYATSSCYWTICVETRKAIDPSDGIELTRRRAWPWQEPHYVSLEDAIEPKEVGTDGKHKRWKHFSTEGKKRLTEIRKSFEA